MKLFENNKRNLNLRMLIYYGLIFLCVVLSLIYGNLVTLNIGRFDSFMISDTGFSSAFTYGIPALITFIYLIVILIGRRNNFFKYNFNLLGWITILITLQIYMTIIIIFKDNTHLYDPDFNPVNMPTQLEKMQSILSFYLSLMMIFSFFVLFKNSKYTRFFIVSVLLVINIYVISCISYSIATEQDKYLDILKNPMFFIKEYNLMIKSWYAIGNVFSHTVLIGLFNTVVIGIILKKKWIKYLSLLFIPFVYFGGCRSAFLTMMIFYIILAYCTLYRITKKKTWLFLTFNIFVILIISYFLLDIFVFKFIHVEEDGETLYLIDLVRLFNKNLIGNRLNLIKPFFERYTLEDFILGTGYGMNYIPPRTQGFLYYMHNTALEIYFAGGIFYLLFMIFCALLSLVYIFKCKKQNRGLVSFYISLIISLSFYGFFESVPFLFNDFFGGMFGFLICGIPAMLVQEVRCQSYDIYSLNIFGKKIKFNLNLTHAIYGIDKLEFTNIDEQLVNMEEELLVYMKNNKVYNLNVCILFGLKEDYYKVKYLNNKENMVSYNYGFYNKEENKYYIYNSFINKLSENEIK